MPYLHCRLVSICSVSLHEFQDRIGFELCMLAADLTVLGTLIRTSILVDLLKENKVHYIGIGEAELQFYFHSSPIPLLQLWVLSGILEV